MSIETEVVRRVVCAACRSSKTGNIILGPRHFDKVMWVHANLYNGDEFDEQGFIDQWGVYMNRHEAHLVAKASGQIVHRCGGDQHTLYSENLY